ncbi:MAG: class D sortase [Acidobacteria bacterium]|nr:class D sortase [Acidobacteriota bacterium]MCA1611447.1 class D sortase [Acidobacteriota bacterium]
MRTRRLLSALLIVTGLGLCGVAARHYVRGWQAQAEGRRQLAGGGRRENPGVERVSDRLGLDSDEVPHSGEIPADYPYGQPIARLKIPVARIDSVVFAGADQDTLEKGPGHVPGTEMPGAAPPLHNCVITGHRDSHFRHLGWLKEGTDIELDAPGGNRLYRVVSREIVKPDAVRVLEPTASPRLTLITCYPFNYIGPAPRRLVVVALPFPR